MDSRKLLLALALRYNNDWNAMFRSIQRKDDVSDDEIAAAENFTGNYITILDAEYPERLKHRPKPPFILYYDGDLSVLNRVDHNNNLVFLYGPNTFDISNDKLVIITDDHKINLCGSLKVWFNDESKNPDRFGLAAALAMNVACTKVYYRETRSSWLISLSIFNAMELGGNIYMIPTHEPSWNNEMIKQGAFLLDSRSDIVN